MLHKFKGERNSFGKDAKKVRINNFNHLENLRRVRENLTLEAVKFIYFS